MFLHHSTTTLMLSRGRGEEMKLGWTPAILLLGLAACDQPATNREPETRTTEPVTTTTPERTTTAESSGTLRVADIMSAPATYAGRTVTVVADVDEVFGPRAFALDEDSPLAGGIDNDLLVFSPKAGTLANLDDKWTNNKVRVTGTIRIMPAADLERELGWDLDRKIEGRIDERKPVLVASSVERVTK